MPIYGVRDAMHELGRSPHIQSREQAIAVGLKAERQGSPIGGRDRKKKSSRKSSRGGSRY